jgi:flavin reductase (DIM6/NTAB) family NADH-FMN oxidoreductase RutF
MSTMIDTGVCAALATHQQMDLHGHLPQDTKALRNALGCYPTGIAIVTCRNAEGRAVGLTINSFASLSLEPPLVLWSLVNRSPSLSAFSQCEHFSVNVLAVDQAELARRFASSAVQDKFEHARAYDSPEGVPLIPASLASFVCAREQLQAGGDHTLFVGRVLRYYTGAGDPAVFHRGQFTQLSALAN